MTLQSWVTSAYFIFQGFLAKKEPDTDFFRNAAIHLHVPEVSSHILLYNQNWIHQGRLPL